MITRCDNNCPVAKSCYRHEAKGLNKITFEYNDGCEYFIKNDERNQLVRYDREYDNEYSHTDKTVFIIGFIVFLITCVLVMIKGA